MIRSLCLASLASLFVVACAQGTGSQVRVRDRQDGGSGGGVCGLRGIGCCDGVCDPGLLCMADLCVSPGDACGSSGQACCSVGTPCNGGLSCNAGVCGAGLTDGGVPPRAECGMHGIACCASGPACMAGLVCGGSGTCEPETGCGAADERCCNGGLCNSGLVCENSLCLVPITMCRPDGQACMTSTECCNANCVSGVCGGSTRPPPSRCAAYRDCGSCTTDNGCMWCNSGCVDFELSLEAFFCAWYPEDCV